MLCGVSSFGLSADVGFYVGVWHFPVGGLIVVSYFVAFILSLSYLFNHFLADISLSGNGLRRI